jgi:hypothetical protein
MFRETQRTWARNPENTGDRVSLFAGFRRSDVYRKFAATPKRLQAGELGGLAGLEDEVLLPEHEPEPAREDIEPVVRRARGASARGPRPGSGPCTREWRWESQAACETLCSSGPDREQRAAMLMVFVQEYDIADVRLVFGKEAE